MLTQRSKTLAPGARIRVLVIDDSTVVRTMIARAFQDHPEFEVVGTAANGAIGLAKIEQLHPDIITLDIEMPEMDGLEMLRKLREKGPEPYVIMLSTLTEPGAAATLDALMLGANDYVTKPSKSASLTDSITTLRNELGPKIRQFFKSTQQPKTSTPALTPAPSRVVVPAACAAPARLCSRAVVAIGISTGGPNALSAIIPTLPSSFPLPILIVQHMPPVFTKLLAERLQTLSAIRIEEAANGSVVQPGKILIAPGGYHMRVKKAGPDTVVALDEGERRNSCRPSVDVLFESVNEIYGAKTIAAILTGMGQDGLAGVQLLKANGAYVVAQDENTSVVWGMPGFVVRAGLADSVLPLDGIIPEVMKQANSGMGALAARRS